MDIKRVFSAISKQMLIDFEEMSSQIKHPGEKGGARESALARFLERYLPKRFSISSGEIIDVDQNSSNQCDLIIYDHEICPLLLAGNDYRVFPSEPVFAVIEVKSVLTRTELEDAVKKIGVIKNLKRANGKILGVIFTYKLGWTGEGISKLAAHLYRINQGMDTTQYVDLICVLDAGFIETYPIEGDETSKAMVTVSDMDVSPLLYFFIRLLDRIEQIQSMAPRYASYLGSTSIGLAEFTTPLGEKLI